MFWNYVDSKLKNKNKIGNSNFTNSNGTEEVTIVSTLLNLKYLIHISQEFLLKKIILISIILKVEILHFQWKA